MADTATDDLSSKLQSALDAPSGGGGAGKPPVDMARLRGALGLDKINDRLAGENAELDSLKENMAFPKLTAPPPQQPQTDPFQAFGQPAMYLAIFGSLLTRNPLASAVNAGASVLKNTQAKDSAIGQQQYEQWKIASENSVKLAQYEMNAYKAALSAKTGTIREQEAAIRTAAAVFKNPNLQTILDSQGVEGAQGYVKAYEKHVNDVAEAHGPASEHVTTHVTGGGGGNSKAQTATNDLIAEAIGSGDPTKMAMGIELYQKQLLSSQAAKGDHSKMETVQLKLSNLKAALRSGDEDTVAAAVKAAREDADLGPALMSGARPQKATAGSVAAERESRFAELKKTDPTASDSAIWDKVNQEVFISKSAHFPPGTAEMLADRAIAGDFSGLTGFGRSPQLLSQLDAALSKRMAEHDPPLTGGDLARIKTQFAAYAQGVKAFEAGGKLEPVPRYLNNVVQHLDTLSETARALAQNDMPALNALQNTLGTEFGLSGPVTFDAIKGIVAAEIEKAVTGSAGAVTDREDLKANLNKSLNSEQLSKVINGYEALMAGQLAGVEQTYDRVQKLGGAPGGDFKEKFLSQRTRDVLGGKSAGASVGTAKNAEGHTLTLDPARGLYKNPETGKYWDGKGWVD